MKIFLFVSILFFSLSGLAHEVTVQDLYGRTVKTPSEVKKVVAIGPGALRILVYSGAQDLIVGRELFEDKISKSLRPYTYSLPEYFKDLPVISVGGPGKMPDIEQLIITNPDVIFAVGFAKEQLENINLKTRIPVVGLSYGAAGHADLEKIKESIRLTGYITHRQKVAQSVMNKMAMLRKDLYARTENQPSKKVYMAAIAYKGAKDFTSSEKDHPSCDMINVENIADAIVSPATHVTMQLETILKNQPDYIFYDVVGLELLKNSYGTMIKTLSLLYAVQEGRVFSILPYNWYNPNLENIYLTAYYMGKKLYPEKFIDVDIAQIADDIYNVFLHNDPYKKIISANPAYRRVIFEKDGFSFGE